MADHEHPDDAAAGTPDDVSFEVEDERLDKALKRKERERAGAPGAEFGHDQTYRPGYHQGGVRFGFFHHDEPKDKPDGKP
ncbi:hypothetical protein [Phenylobacterium sp.]|uniref:hypothetical protein n=1 Tax=Phenylobacterium sp. TaxID=1871053 RepID=UPI00122BBFE0|nr:hypothetical protein [Phenylobacterium sp.]THD62607.1 MAG: hypothetical protein E8A12_09315 [Phenylobacterium sp.]